MSKLLKYGLLFVGLFLAWWILSKPLKLPFLTDLFRSKPLLIEDTPLLLKEVRQIAELSTVVGFEEVVADSTRIQTLSLSPGSAIQVPVPMAPARLVIIGTGSVRAGLKLDAITEQDLKVRGDSVWIQLPPARILDAIINPSDFETFIQQGDWSPEAIQRVKIKARDELIQSAVRHGILQRAETRNRLVLEELLKKSGFKSIHFQ